MRRHHRSPYCRTVIDRIAGTAPADLDVRRRTIRWAIAEECGNVSRVARRLGISRSTLWFHLENLGMGREPAEIRAASRARYVVP
jgi:transcriptional regulator of acetoin/glycerol metabolism